jgi:hypothetical protein
MEKEMSPLESLSIISSMIEKARHNISDKSQYFLLWGYAVFIACISQFIMLSVNYEKNYLAWYIMFPALIAHIILIRRDHKREKVTTYINDANKYLWTGIGFSFMVIVFIFAKIGWEYCLPFYVLMYALGTFISGSLIKFKPMIIGGILCFIIAACIPYFEGRIQILLAALSILVSYIIPGHLLRTRYKQQNN